MWTGVRCSVNHQRLLGRHERACGIVGVWPEPRRVVADTDRRTVCVKIAMPDEQLPAISIFLDPTDDSLLLGLVGHRLAGTLATNVFSRFLPLPFVVPWFSLTMPRLMVRLVRNSPG